MKTFSSTGKAMKSTDDWDLERLETLCGTPGEEVTAVQRWYLTFHNALATASHNEFLEKAMATIRGEMFVGVPPEGEQPRPDDLLTAHQAIFEAVRDRDPARARELTERHHEFLYKFLWAPGVEES